MAATYDALWWFYVGLTIVWTLALAGGMYFLYRHRQLPFLQIRKLGLLFSAVILLHMFAMSCTLGLTYRVIVPCEAQFWVMSLYLPFGIALLQASNTQFQYIASQQRKYASIGNLEEQQLSEKSTQIDKSLPWHKRAVLRCRKADKPTRTVIYIGVGMVVQVLLTAFLFFGSEMFHPSYGFFNIKVPATEAERALKCLTGWEWWLSIVWQFFWTWFYAPYLLWKTRHIHDTHGWRVQTIGCCLSFLPASPMWLVSLYAPSFAAVNPKFVPPMWFAASIFFAQIFIIFLPCWQVLKTHKLQKETLDAISSWEERNGGAVDADDMSSKSAGVAGTTLGGGSSIAGRSAGSRATNTTKNSRKSDMLTMAALENALRKNPQPLLEFAALKDFSGENVSFLTHVADWKRSMAAINPRTEGYRAHFVRAVRIYSHFISLEYSEFPVNISSRAAKELHHIFDDAAHALNRRRSTQSDSATPFGDAHSLGSDTYSVPGSSGGHNPFDLESTLGKANLVSVTQMAELSATDSRVDIPIPDKFSPAVLDIAENEIKYLVLTNTWPKFVIAGFDSISQAEAKEADQGQVMRHVRKYICGGGDPDELV